MSAAPSMVSTGDEGVLNREVSPALLDVWIDRDLGWPDFNERVLAEALDPRTPLLERAKFLAIFTSNLDEFFMKRVAVLRKASTPERVELLGKVRERILHRLEHSRIFHFAAALDDPAQGEFYIGSADWMYRNLSKRVEVVTPVLAKEAREKLWEVLDICLKDRRQAWMLQEDGTYSQLKPGDASGGPEALGTHAALMERAMDLARRRSE